MPTLNSACMPAAWPSQLDICMPECLLLLVIIQMLTAGTAPSLIGSQASKCRCLLLLLISASPCSLSLSLFAFACSSAAVLHWSTHYFHRRRPFSATLQICPQVTPQHYVMLLACGDRRRLHASAGDIHHHAAAPLHPPADCATGGVPSGGRRQRAAVLAAA